jgi:hypothetical protein
VVLGLRFARARVADAASVELHWSGLDSPVGSGFTGRAQDVAGDGCAGARAGAAVAGVVLGPRFARAGVVDAASVELRRSSLDSPVGPGFAGRDCWDRPSALAGIDHRLFCRSTVGSFAETRVAPKRSSAHTLPYVFLLTSSTTMSTWYFYSQGSAP